ncbi:MAG: OmpA family protein [Pseudomonadota bacterium]|nr:OmpA family protein [Burkholderiaceae bacterium]MDQ3446717.1 OmpA family protein [Pseudomonadota bacterium]
MRKIMALTASAVLATFTLGACETMDDQQRRTATGAGAGAAAGAAIGAIGNDSNRGRGAAAGAAIGAAVGALGGYVWNKRMESQQKQIQQQTQGTGVEVNRTADNRLQVVIPGDIAFDSGQAAIRPNFRSALDNFAQSLQQNPSSTVTIIGHTDSTGSPAMNEPLSLQRADATRDYLASRGVASNRFSIDGRGSREPIASNDTEAGRARNRRVEIFLGDRDA